MEDIILKKEGTVDFLFCKFVTRRLQREGRISGTPIQSMLLKKLEQTLKTVDERN